MEKRQKVNEFLLFRRDKFLVELYGEGKTFSMQELGSLFGLTRQAINKILKKHGKQTSEKL